MFEDSKIVRQEVIDIGDTVVCDLCNTDFTASDESGGILFGSYAACPKCTPRLEADAQKYNEENNIVGRCPEGVSFADWVRGLRGGNNTITITEYEKDGN